MRRRSQSPGDGPASLASPSSTYPPPHLHTHSRAVFWSETPEALLTKLGTCPDGLTGNDAAIRLQRIGANEIAPARAQHLLARFLGRLANPLVALLLAAAVVAGVTGDTASLTIIALVVFASTALDMFQEHRAEVAVEALRQSIAIKANVLRDGRPTEIPVREIVPGDVVQLCAGDLVPADGLVLLANGLQVNESLLTGEPYPVAKQPGRCQGSTPVEASNALFQGTSLVGGTATMLVVETGKRTRFGVIAASLAERQPATAFERDIHALGSLIVRLTLFLSLFVLLAHLALGRPPLQSFLFAMALAVGLTPELLPMIMTVALARGAQRMAEAKVVVKRLSAIHDFGQMDVLCTDKTGTLTEAHIRLVSHPGADGKDDDRVAELAAVNARFESGLKSPLDEALLAHADTLPLDRWRKLDERPFDFEKRRVSVLVERGAERMEIVKGAPEAILSQCSLVQARDGTIAPLDEIVRGRLLAMQDEQARHGLRLLAIAWKLAPGCERIGEGDPADLIFAGYCVFEDPPRQSATATIARLRAANVRIKVISGDAPAVVEHLVASLALPMRGIVTGPEIQQLDDAALAARVDRADLFARVTPDQKTRIVRALQARGRTVGFLGDGINDAPAIRAADVGLSVDGATDVAREAADMILLSTDLGVLADGVMEGRRTHANIMKYIRMGTSSNFGNMLTMALASLWLPFLPLTPVQLLLNNLLYDISEIGIPFDHADPEDVATPQGWDNRALLRFTFIMGALSSLFDFATFALLLRLHVDVGQFRTGWFVESMATQILVVFTIRTIHPAWQSRPHRLLVASAMIGLLTALLIPILPDAGLIGFVRPGWIPGSMILLLVVGYLGCAELLKGFALRPLPIRNDDAGR